MKYILLITLLITSCSKHVSHETSISLDEAREIADSQLAELQRDSFGFIPVEHPCDGLTFSSLLDAYTDYSVDLYQARRDDGRWFRSPSMDCFRTGKSRSSISRDGILMLFHAMYAKGDNRGFIEMRDYLIANDWVMGEGPSDYVWMKPYKYLLDNLIKDTKLLSNNYEIDDLFKYFRGFRGHLIAMYVYLESRRKGYINDVELKALDILVDENPDNPLFMALHQRFTTGDQRRTLEMMGHYPDDLWPSCPYALHYALTVNVMEGR